MLPWNLFYQLRTNQSIKTSAQKAHKPQIPSMEAPRASTLVMPVMQQQNSMLKCQNAQSHDVIACNQQICKQYVN